MASVTALAIPAQALSGCPSVTYPEVKIRFCLVLPFGTGGLKKRAAVRCAKNAFPHVSITTAGIGTLLSQVAGLHRAGPSATLDKAI